MARTDLDGMWRAVTGRDRSADGRFVYAVRSTRVYCRPSCPSRRPHRVNVTFYPAPALAEADGYRACRRCHPRQAAAASDAQLRIERICRAVMATPAAGWTAARLAHAGGCTPAQMRRAFRTVVGISPHEYVRATRRRALLSDLQKGVDVTRATYDAGFGSMSRIYDAVMLGGMTPATYGAGGAGARITWLSARSPVGRVLVAATPRGVCFVEIGEDVASLVEALRREFPKADIATRPDRALEPYIQVALAVAGGEATTAGQALSVDVRATAFQWRVWRALTRIPRGETRSYSELARSLGAPRAVRAVARACATNPLALVVPCHRVLGADGQLRGYRWGLDVKRRLLDRERS